MFLCFVLPYASGSLPVCIFSLAEVSGRLPVYIFSFADVSGRLPVCRFFFLPFSEGLSVYAFFFPRNRNVTLSIYSLFPTLRERVLGEKYYADG